MPYWNEGFPSFQKCRCVCVGSQKVGRRLYHLSSESLPGKKWFPSSAAVRVDFSSHRRGVNVDTKPRRLRRKITEKRRRTWAKLTQVSRLQQKYLSNSETLQAHVGYGLATFQNPRPAEQPLAKKQRIPIRTAKASPVVVACSDSQTVKCCIKNSSIPRTRGLRDFA